MFPVMTTPDNLDLWLMPHFHSLPKTEHELAVLTKAHDICRRVGAGFQQGMLVPSSYAPPLESAAHEIRGLGVPMIAGFILEVVRRVGAMEPVPFFDMAYFLSITRCLGKVLARSPSGQTVEFEPHEMPLVVDSPELPKVPKVPDAPDVPHAPLPSHTNGFEDAQSPEGIPLPETKGEDYWEKHKPWVPLELRTDESSWTMGEWQRVKNCKALFLRRTRGNHKNRPTLPATYAEVLSTQASNSQNYGGEVADGDLDKPGDQDDRPGGQSRPRNQQ